MSVSNTYCPTAPKKRLPSTPEVALKCLNALLCIVYAATEHNTDITRPFWSAFRTAFNIGLYCFGGQWIGDFFPVTGDLAIIGTLCLVLSQPLLTKSA
jgi:hypothetical protein